MKRAPKREGSAVGRSAGDEGRRPDTQDILQHLASDPDRGWADLLQRVESKLRVLLHFRMRRAVRDVVSEDDLLQEVWAEAIQNLDRFDYRGPGSLQRWLAGILHNKFLHAGRSRHRLPMAASQLPAPTQPQAQAPSDDSSRRGLLDALESSRSGASREARRRELEESVQRVLSTLPAVEREAVLLKIYEGLTGREAAARLGVDESTISLRYGRALDACARHLEGFVE